MRANLHDPRVLDQEVTIRIAHDGLTDLEQNRQSARTPRFSRQQRLDHGPPL